MTASHLSSLHGAVVQPVHDQSQVGEARRAVALLAESCGLSESDRGRLALVVTEAANNLARHAREGLLAARAVIGQQAIGIEVLTVDRGPGMADVQRCMADGFSSIGTPGTGLGAIARTASLFDVYSQEGIGTTLVTQIWPESYRNGGPLQSGAIAVPHRGESVCGDGWAIAAVGGRHLFMLADGLGHGPVAAEASRAAIDSFMRSAEEPLEEILRIIHDALKPTRGAAVAIASLSPAERLIRFAGVGNISGSSWGPSGSRSMVSHNGTLGHTTRRLQEFQYAWNPGDILFMHSDGLSSHWRLDKYPGLHQRHPSVIAATLWRDHTRDRDDVTVMVAKEAP